MKINNLEELKLNINNLSSKQLLYYSSKYNYKLGAKLALKHLDIKYHESISLNVAIQNENVDIVKLLLKNRNYVNNEDVSFNFAIGNGSLEMVKLLVKNGLNYRINEEEPLKTAIEFNRYDIIEYLLEMGANTTYIGTYYKNELNKIYNKIF